jgi:hypothetical protein
VNYSHVAFSFSESDEFIADDLDACADDSPDSPVIYSHVAPPFPDSSRFTVDQPRAPNSPVCQARAGFGCTQPTLFQHLSSFLGTVSST